MVSLWFILVFPWQYFNVPAIRIIEPIILFSLLFFIYKNKGKITYETFCKIYFALISIGLIYTFGFPLFRNSDLLNIGHRIHLFLFMAEIFLVYLIIYNLVDNKKLKLKKLFDNFFFIHLFIAAIYIYVGVSVQAGSMAVNRIAYSAAPDMTGGGNFYISNGVPWIFMIQNSIILGYFIKHDKSIINLIRLILLSILPIIISYLNMSRSAIIFSSLITILALSQIFLQDLFNRRFFTIKHFIKQLIFITAFSLLLIQITIQYNKQNLLIKYIEYSIGSKGDTKNIRLGLVNESIRYGFETYLIGGGIGYLDLDKDKLNNSYKFLKRNSPQNTFASIFAELGTQHISISSDDSL